MNAKIGDHVVARRIYTGDRVRGRLTRIYNDGCALIENGDDHYTVSQTSVLKPLAR